VDEIRIRVRLTKEPVRIPSSKEEDENDDQHDQIEDDDYENHDTEMTTTTNKGKQEPDDSETGFAYAGSYKEVQSTP
jgi:hypothetical protein